jgi:hypothetical protein
MGLPVDTDSGEIQDGRRASHDVRGDEEIAHRHSQIPHSVHRLQHMVTLAISFLSPSSQSSLS